MPLAFPRFMHLEATPHAPITAARRRLLIRSYAPDWALTIILAVIFFSLDKVHGYRRLFSLDDPTIQFTYAVHERIPDVALYFICFVAPFCIMPMVNFLTLRSWWDFHSSSLGLVLSLVLTGSITQVVKITVGRPRPDFIDRCQPPSDGANPHFGLTSWTVCTQTDFGIMNDGFRSFFSGHSSLSFAGLGFFSYYLAGKVHLFDKRGHAGKAWLALSPFMAASLVAISRTMDYRHHWQDVLVGSLVGTVFSYFGYRQYYPSLSSSLSHRPYSPRIPSDDDSSEVALPVHRPMRSHDYPFLANNGSNLDVRNNGQGSFELSGTVPRQEPVFHEVWKQGGGSAVENAEFNDQLASTEYSPFGNDTSRSPTRL